MLFTDQLGSVVQIEHYPKRIISLVPSQTELLFDLGLEDRVVGITKFCVHPDNWFRSKERIGGTKQVNYDKIQELAPDLIIANKEENTQEIVDKLSMNWPVWVSDIKDLDGALQMIHSIGKLTDRESEAQRLISQIQVGFDSLKTTVKTDQKRRTVHYYIWNDPDMLAGEDTFIGQMIEAAGFKNGVNKKRYPVYESEMGTADLVFLSSEPFPFKEVHIEKFQQRYPKARIVKVDGELCSWYGSRLKYAPDYFKKLRESLSE